MPDAFIRCPGGGQMTFSLPPGQKDMYVQIPRPQTNVDWRRYVTSEPSWGMDLTKLLPVGRTDVTYSAQSPATNNSATCHLAIIIKDEENPSVHGCPNDIEVNLQKGEMGQSVYWREPHFMDNVGVAHVYKSRVCVWCEVNIWVWNYFLGLE